MEAQVVLEEALPILQRPWSDAVPELLLDGALQPLHLTVEVGASGPDAGVAYVQAAEQCGEIVPELGAVVRLDAAQREGDGLQESWKGSADGGGGAPLQDSGGQEAATVVSASGGS